MDCSVDYSYLLRLAGYIQSAVRQGAFLSFNTVLERFQKCTKLTLGGKRQQKRYRKKLKELASKFGFKFVFAHGQRGETLFVTSQENSHFDHKYAQEAPLAHSLLKILHETKERTIKVYASLLKQSKLTKKSLERPIAELKKKAYKFGLFFKKIGRELHVCLKYKVKASPSEKTYKNTPQKGDMHYNIVAKDKEILRNTANAEIRFTKSMSRKAFSLARNLAKQFYDNCKVKLCMPMLVKFTRWAIHQGYEDKLIEGRFNQALLQRHADATDMGLNQGVRLMFEMSSTVSLAKTFLLESTKDNHQKRWQTLKEIVFPQRKLIQKVFIRKTKSVSFIENPTVLTQEEKIQEILFSNGFSIHQIKIFFHCQSNTMSNDLLANYQPLIRNIVKCLYINMGKTS